MVKNNDRDANSSLSRALPGYRRTLAVVAVGLLTLAACGSSESKADDGVASVNDVSGAAAGSDTTAVAGDPNEVFAEYEKCLQDEGIDTEVLMGDVSEGGNQVGDETSSETIPADFDWEALEAADEICAPILDDFDPYAGMTPEEKAAVDDYLVELEKCMADKGFDIPMTETSGGNTVGDADETDYTFPPDTDFEELEAAYEECDKEVELPEALKELEESMTSEP